MKRKRQQNGRQLKGSFTLFCEGETEQNYFSSLNKDLHNSQNRDKMVTIKPELPKTTMHCIELINKAIEETKEIKIRSIDEVFVVIDIDKVREDRKESEYQSVKTKAEKLGIVILESNPCFEYWFLLHFNAIDRCFECFNDLDNELQKHFKKNKLAEYTKNNQRTKCIYDELKEWKETACDRAQEIANKKREKSEKFSYTLVYKLYAKINKKIGKNK